jgi:uncharacterized protein
VINPTSAPRQRLAALVLNAGAEALYSLMNFWIRFVQNSRRELASVASVPRDSMPVFQVKVKPSARESAFHALDDGSFFARLKSAPVDGKANAELIALVSKHFQVSKSAVTIKSGAGARVKLVAVALPEGHINHFG